MNIVLLLLKLKGTTMGLLCADLVLTCYTYLLSYIDGNGIITEWGREVVCPYLYGGK